jgi:hypothetical protein
MADPVRGVECGSEPVGTIVFFLLSDGCHLICGSRLNHLGLFHDESVLYKGDSVGFNHPTDFIKRRCSSRGIPHPFSVDEHMDFPFVDVKYRGTIGNFLSSWGSRRMGE